MVGPFTLKQFIWIATGAGIDYLLFLTLKGGIWFWVLAIPISTIALALAFLKIDDEPLLNYIVYFINYSLRTKKYMFRKDNDKII